MPCEQAATGAELLFLPRMLPRLQLAVLSINVVTKAEATS